MAYIKKFKKNYKIRKIVQQLLDEKIKILVRSFRKPAKVGMEVPIHQDNFYWNLNNSKGLTVWIALDKCTKKRSFILFCEKSKNWFVET